ncbi:hypothetical protein N0B44_03575 [Roseibacterium beibuensis]|uniref:Uncharacterized protein n=1 Tax=[Roseibacterium] beibuensis TaxID=1193142 RepID=A0ABP9KWN1_9RHOB|nr:hypothetical protein [Roseibacterium beibuensis]MCS6621987.1 hypothetical protein [Roseibacterium beibuensis]
MEWLLWGFAGLAAVVAVILGIALYVVLIRDRDTPNQGPRKHARPGRMPRSDPRRGVPKSR